jgi:1-acyl-sn-glycerol-3-phosphate acyltransferase
VKNIFVAIFRFFQSRRIVLFVIFGILISVFAFLAMQLKLENDLNAMMPKDKNQKDISSVLTNNKQLDKIIASVSLKDTTASDPDLLISFTEEFAQLLVEKDHDKIISSVETKQNEELFLDIIQSIQNNLPFLLNEKDYQKIDSLIQPNEIKSILLTNYKTLASPGGVAMKQMITKDPLGLTYLALKKMQDMKQDETTQLFDGYILSGDQKTLTFFIHSTYPGSNTKMNQGLSNLIHEISDSLKLKEEFSGIQFDVFGGQLVAAGNASQMRADTILTLSITIILLLLLFVFFFRNFLAPLQIMIPVAFGGLFGMAMMFLLKGKVSMIALGASSVILGIAVNYSLHFLSHYRHSRDKAETIRELSIPMTIGGFTTVFAFLSLNLMHTPVLRELGLFTAFNLIGSSLCTLIFLPHFIQRKTENLNASVKHSEVNLNWLDKISHYSPNKSKWVVIGICVITIFLSFFTNKVRFNEDMMTMNYMSKELRNSQKIINEKNAESLNSVFCVSEGNTLDQALKGSEKASIELSLLKNKGIIRKYSSIGDFILSDSVMNLKVQMWNSFWTENKKNQVFNQLKKEGIHIGFQSFAFDGIQQILSKQYIKPDTSFDRTFNSLFKDFIIKDQDGYKLLTLIKTTQENRKQLFQNFESSDNTYLTDKQFITTKFVQYIKDDFYKILFLTSFIVFITILISYGRIELALISFIPMVITWVCILGLMGLLGIEFNIINIIISTLIFGLGDDYSIFITDGLIEKYKYGKLKINATKTSILLSAITTMIGLGILIFAKHPALRSIALVSVIGIFSILIVSQTLQPLLFNFFIQNRTDKKLHPFTLWSFAKTIFAFTYYVLGCLLITVIGFFLTKLIPFFTGKQNPLYDKLKYIYHVIVCKGMWSILYLMCNTRKKIMNRDLMDFSKPAVLIANHSSVLDLQRIISLHPKILLLTNKWVWRSPVFGPLVRMADYYPVEEGAEFSIEKMKYWVDRGYSIAVFPEGTRSYDSEMKRFHKGAFYIAEKLNLDIQPLIFQGIGYSMSKGDFLLKDGEINCKFMPRITNADTHFGNTYSERAKSIGKYFRSEYEAFRKERETVHYFKEQLIRNYIYKGPILEWYCRIKIKLEGYYETIEKHVPKKGHILDIGCGYGYLDYILSWTSKERQIKGVDYDEEKISVATHNFSINDHLSFEAIDALSLTENNKYDCILLMDVLHYLVPEKQQLLLNKISSLLSDGGVFILRDGITEMSKKITGTKLSEFFSTTLFKFNKTENELHFISLEMIKTFAKENQFDLEIIDDTKFTSNILIVMRKK